MAKDNIKFEKDGVIVYIATNNIKENYNNALRIIKFPTTNDEPETTQIINLNKMEDRFTVSGYISNGKLDATETHTTALAKKNALKVMVAKGSTISFSWDGTTFDFAVDKYEIGYVAKDDKDDLSDGVIVYTTTISGTAGEDII